MKKYISWLAVLTKRQLKKVSFLLLLIVVPAVTLICTNLSVFNKGNNELVLLFAEDNDISTKRIIDSLVSSKTEFIFQVCDSREQLIDMVHTRKALCGYIIKPELTQKLQAEKYARNVDLILRKDSTLSDAANEQFFAKYLKEMTYNLALQIIKDSTGVEEETASYNIRDEFNSYMYQDENSFLNIIFLHQDKNVEVNLENGVMLFSVSGIMGVVMLLGGLMGVGIWIMDKKEGRLTPITRGNSFTLRIMYILIPILLLGLSTFISVCASRGFSKLGFTGILVELKNVLIYALVLAAVVLLLSYIIHSLDVLIALEVALVIASLVMCPIFIDFSTFMPILKTIRLILPPYWYMVM